MNSFVNDENVSPKVIVGTNTNGTVKSFVFGEDIQNIGCGSCFTSPIAKTIQRGHDETDPDVAKRRKHNPWTKEEDHRLMEIMKNAHSGEVMVAEIPNILNFSQVAKILGTGRTTKQCRDRWKNYLRGGIKKGDWTTEECDLINDLYTTFGARWSAMSKILTNRTDNDIKNKWYAMKRKGERLGIDVRSDSYMESSVMNRTDDSVVNENKTTNNLFQSRHWGSRKVFH